MLTIQEDERLHKGERLLSDREEAILICPEDQQEILVFQHDYLTGSQELTHAYCQCGWAPPNEMVWDAIADIAEEQVLNSLLDASETEAIPADVEFEGVLRRKTRWEDQTDVMVPTEAAFEAAQEEATTAAHEELQERPPKRRRGKRGGRGRGHLYALCTQPTCGGFVEIRYHTPTGNCVWFTCGICGWKPQEKEVKRAFAQLLREGILEDALRKGRVVTFASPLAPTPVSVPPPIVEPDPVINVPQPTEEIHMETTQTGNSGFEKKPDVKVDVKPEAKVEPSFLNKAGTVVWDTVVNVSCGVGVVIGAALMFGATKAAQAWLGDDDSTPSS